MSTFLSVCLSVTFFYGFYVSKVFTNSALGGAVVDSLKDLVSVLWWRFGRPQLGGEVHPGWGCWERPSAALSSSLPVGVTCSKPLKTKVTLVTSGGDGTGLVVLYCVACHLRRADPYVRYCLPLNG